MSNPVPFHQVQAFERIRALAAEYRVKRDEALEHAAWIEKQRTEELRAAISAVIYRELPDVAPFADLERIEENGTYNVSVWIEIPEHAPIGVHLSRPIIPDDTWRIGQNVYTSHDQKHFSVWTAPNRWETYHQSSDLGEVLTTAADHWPEYQAYRLKQQQAVPEGPAPTHLHLNWHDEDLIQALRDWFRGEHEEHEECR